MKPPAGMNALNRQYRFCFEAIFQNNAGFDQQQIYLNITRTQAAELRGDNGTGFFPLVHQQKILYAI